MTGTQKSGTLDMDEGAIARATLPTATRILVNVIEAVRAAGGSATNEEISKHVINGLDLTEAQQQVLRADGRRTQIEQAISEAKSYLKRADLLDRSAGGIWTTTEAGETASRKEIEDAPKVTYALQKERRIQVDDTDVDSEDASDDSEAVEVRPGHWKEILRQRLMELSPAEFEKLGLRLLREAGFDSVRVRGKVGDEGIDGEGIYRIGLVSFHVYWQSKRYAGTVSSEDVRNFRGAMIGRGDKGLFITTGTFTEPARREGSREGAPPIDLIDGDKLAELLAEYRLGVKVTQQTKDVHTVDLAWFDSI